MRTLAIAGVAAGLVLAGCGTAQTAVPVESRTASGAVASADECPANSPVRGILKGELDGDDGVFGHVYNRTSDSLWVWSQSKESPGPCLLQPGQGASFAGAMDAEGGPFAEWRPGTTQGDPEATSERENYFLLVTKANDVSAQGVALELYDPFMGYPTVNSRYRTASGAGCRDKAVLRTGGLKENAEYRLKGSEQGSVLVKRLGDSKEIAREWMPGKTNTDDWARIDLDVESIGMC